MPTPVSCDEVLPPNYQEYPDGSLLRVVFHNFLTYEHTSFVPTANLNMILGHNGSGKSSIICGICLACGGNPKSLGRSERISEYIRHGCTDGYVEIAIADEQRGPQTVRLTIRIGKSPEYRVNNTIVEQKQVVDLRNHYNIQIDNPCAFLAQDKVKSFSEQSSIELLRNTEKAASADLDQKHTELISSRVSSTSVEDMCESSEKAVKDLENQITKIMPLVENYRKKLALETKLRLLEKKNKVLEFENAEIEYENEKMKVDDALKEYREVEALVEATQAKEKMNQIEVNKQRDVIDALQSSAKDILIKVQTETDKKLIDNALTQAKMKLDSVKNNANQHEQEIKITRRNIQSATDKLKEANENLAGYDAFLEEHKRSEAKLEDIESEYRQEEDAIQRKQYEVRALENKKQEEDKLPLKNQKDRMDELRVISNASWQAYEWYHRNRNQFDGPVYVPVMDIVLKTPEAPKLLDNSIAIRDRAMFVFSSKKDELLLSGKGYRINTSVVSADRISPEKVNGKLPGELKKLGFKYFLSECFDAPLPLKQYLCNVAGLHEIPYGLIEEDRIDSTWEVLERLGLRLFMSPTTRFQLQRSKYSGKSLQTHSALRDSRDFYKNLYRESPYPKSKTNDGTSEEIQKLKAEIEIRREGVKQKRSILQKERDQLRNNQLQWKAKKTVQIKWNSDIIRFKNQLKDLEGETIDTATAEAEYAVVKQTVAEQTKVMLENCIKGQKQYVEKYRELGRCTVVNAICIAKVAKYHEEVMDYRQRLDGLAGMKNMAEENLQTALNKKKLARTNLVAECQLKHLDEEKMNNIEKKLFAKMNEMFKEAKVPNDLDDLRQEITNERTRLRLAEDSGEDGSANHEQELASLNNKLAAENAKHEKLLQNRQNLHDALGNEIDKWKEEVGKMIERINDNYVSFFETLGCRGEVSLDVPENTLDIEKYGIMIMVSFRKGENMKRLDNKVQSGGERSVATMLYLLALQQLCPVPFRCIDEINQGMDPTNERKVFDIMVGLWNGTSGTLSKTQYFLLSPKLLHGLDLRENVNIVMVNSTLTEDHGKFFDTASKIDATFAHLRINA